MKVSLALWSAHSKCSYSSCVTCFYYSGLQHPVWRAIVSHLLPVCSATLCHALVAMC